MSNPRVADRKDFKRVVLNVSKHLQQPQELVSSILETALLDNPTTLEEIVTDNPDRCEGAFVGGLPEIIPLLDEVCEELQRMEIISDEDIETDSLMTLEDLANEYSVDPEGQIFETENEAVHALGIVFNGQINKILEEFVKQASRLSRHSDRNNEESTSNAPKFSLRAKALNPIVINGGMGPQSTKGIER